MILSSTGSPGLESFFSDTRYTHHRRDPRNDRSIQGPHERSVRVHVPSRRRRSTVHIRPAGRGKVAWYHWLRNKEPEAVRGST